MKKTSRLSDTRKSDPKPILKVQKDTQSKKGFFNWLGRKMCCVP